MGTAAYRGCPLRDAPFFLVRVRWRRHASIGSEGATDVGDGDHPFRVCAQLMLVLQSCYGAGRATSSPSEERRPGLLRAPTHPSARKRRSSKLAYGIPHKPSSGTTYRARAPLGLGDLPTTCGQLA